MSDSHLQEVMASPPDLHSSGSPRDDHNTTPNTSSPPDTHSCASGRLPNEQAPVTSVPYSGITISQGTGPELTATSESMPGAQHHIRPEKTNQSVAVSEPGRECAKLPGHIDLIGALNTDSLWVPTKLENQELVAIANGCAQQTGDEHRPAKRQRRDERYESPGTSGRLDPPETASDPESLVPPMGNVNQELIAYVWPILFEKGVTKPGDLLNLEFYKPFLCLPRRRDIEWNPSTRRDQWAFKTKIDLVALLVQLTGDYSSQCCTKCDPEVGLFKGCIVTASETLAKQYYGCANCLYHGRQTFCSLKGRNQQRGKKSLTLTNRYTLQQSSHENHSAIQQPAGSPLYRFWSSTTSTRDGNVVQMACSACLDENAACSHERPSCSRCRFSKDECSYSDQAMVPTGAPQPALLPISSDADTTATTYQHPLPQPDSRGQVGKRESMMQFEDSSVPNGANQLLTQQTEPGQSTTTHAELKEVASSSDTAGRRNETTTRLRDILSMEPWERAPGRIRSQASAKPESRRTHCSMRGLTLTCLARHRLLQVIPGHWRCGPSLQRSYLSRRIDPLRPHASFQTRGQHHAYLFSRNSGETQRQNGWRGTLSNRTARHVHRQAALGMSRRVRNIR